MEQKISIKIAERTFNLTAASPEQEEVIRLAAETINRQLETHLRKYPGKSLIALNECYRRISLQRMADARDEEVKALGSELENYLKDNVK